MFPPILVKIHQVAQGYGSQAGPPVTVPASGNKLSASTLLVPTFDTTPFQIHAQDGTVQGVLFLLMLPYVLLHVCNVGYLSEFICLCSALEPKSRL